ncbi:MAG: hypothetical protein QXZ68_06185 [Candidatus Bathyarchaeia archaeon]
MPVPSALVTRFFQLILNKQFAEAERELEKLKQKMHKTEWNRGYFRALYGMLLARRSNNDPYAFFAKLDLNDKEALQAYRREFLDHVKNRLHGEFDRGFFAAWADFTRVASKLNISETRVESVSNEAEGGQKLSEEDKQPSTNS